MPIGECAGRGEAAHLHTCCMDVIPVCCKVFQHPALENAKKAVDKAGLFKPRPKLWIRNKLVASIMAWAQKREGRQRFAMLFLCAYVFLLRLPSEALPIRVDKSGCITGQAVVKMIGGKLSLRLARRKNKEHGSVLERGEHCCIFRVQCHVLRVQDAGVRNAKKPAQCMFWGRGWSSSRMGMNCLRVFRQPMPLKP